jgi:hypothetical protein
MFVRLLIRVEYSSYRVVHAFPVDGFHALLSIFVDVHNTGLKINNKNHRASYNDCGEIEQLSEKKLRVEISLFFFSLSYFLQKKWKISFSLFAQG